MATVHRVYLGLGANIGDRLAYLQQAVDALAEERAVDLVAVSPVYETDPVGGPPQDAYLNAVVALDTVKSPRDLLGLCQRLEAEAGRVRLERWGPRTLDVDLLLVGDEMVDEDDLVVPHPRMAERAFVLAPLSDLDARLAEAPPGGWPGVRRAGLSLRLRSAE